MPFLPWYPFPAEFKSWISFYGCQLALAGSNIVWAVGRITGGRSSSFLIFWALFLSLVPMYAAVSVQDYSIDRSAYVVSAAVADDRTHDADCPEHFSVGRASNVWATPLLGFAFCSSRLSDGQIP